ncbi:MAG: 6-phosphogluconolactonase, partial [Planctomyces sp.]
MTARLELTRKERLPCCIFGDAKQAAALVAREISDLIRRRAAEGRLCVLGLATGSTPTGIYQELVRLHRDEALSFRNVVTFNLDEYYPMQREDLQSYVRFMQEHLFRHIDIPAENINIPDGTLPVETVADFCRAYEEKIVAVGGIDIQILGIGRTGHIGFNEPGSDETTRTRMITLDSVTRIDAASDFFGAENV